MSSEVVERSDLSAMEIRNVTRIEAPVDLVWESLLEELGPAAETHDGTPLRMKLELWPGGRWYRDLGESMGHFWGHVQVVKAPHLLEIAGPLPMSYAATNHVQYRLKAEGATTVLTMTHTAIGLIAADHRDGMPAGWTTWMTRVQERAHRLHAAGTSI